MTPDGTWHGSIVYRDEQGNFFVALDDLSREWQAVEKQASRAERAEAERDDARGQVEILREWLGLAATSTQINQTEETR